MKIAISGKGGAGKTTLAALLARSYAGAGRNVVAIDADPAANLALTLGVAVEKRRRLLPISAMADLIEERTGARPGGSGGMFRLNPEVDDLPERCSITHDGIRLLLLGTVKRGGHGCFCAENALLKALVGHLLLERDDVVIMDMEAGVEHLGRGTAQGVDAFLVVVEPGLRSVAVAEEIVRLADDLGIAGVRLVGNKIRSAEDRAFIAASAPAGFPVAGYLPVDPALVDAERDGVPLHEAAPGLVGAVGAIAAGIA